MTASPPIIYSTREFTFCLLFVSYFVANSFQIYPRIQSATICLTLASQDVPESEDGRPLSIGHCQLPSLQFYFERYRLSVATKGPPFQQLWRLPIWWILVQLAPVEDPSALLASWLISWMSIVPKGPHLVSHSLSKMLTLTLQAGPKASRSSTSTTMNVSYLKFASTM